MKEEGRRSALTSQSAQQAKEEMEKQNKYWNKLPCSGERRNSSLLGSVCVWSEDSLFLYHVL